MWAHASQSVVALGLGCVGSGLVVLVLETLLGVGSAPSRAQLIWLFELTAGAHAGPRRCMEPCSLKPPVHRLTSFRELPFVLQCRIFARNVW